LGRTVCFTGEADGKFAGELPKWGRAGEFYASLARWAAGVQAPLSEAVLPRLEVRHGIAVVELHLDPRRDREPFSGVPEVTVLRAEPGHRPTPERRALRWSGPDLLSLELPLRGAETLLTTLNLPGQRPFPLPPVCSPYSVELSPERGEAGSVALDRLARATGGRERIDLGGIWGELPRRPRRIAVAPWLLSLALVLLLLEVLERRTGLLTRPTRLSLSTMEDRSKRRWFRRSQPAASASPVLAPLPPTENPAPPRTPAAQVETGDMEAALKRAKERTRAKSRRREEG
jgi:hypothetical protein